MLDYKFVEKNLAYCVEQLKRRGFTLDVEEFGKLSGNRKKLIQEESVLRSELNKISKSIGQLIGKHGKDAPEAARAKSEVEQLKEKLNVNKEEKTKAEEDFENFMLLTPNLLDEKTPDGLDEESNVEVSRHNERPEFSFEPKDHTAVGETLGIFDFERAAKLSGARFAILRGPGVVLERAIANFLIDHAAGRGYEEISVPYMVRREIMVGTGQLPKFEEDLFRVESGGREWFL
ncbi:MAG: serine--tRNA ligase, partial [bacterium]